MGPEGLEVLAVLDKPDPLVGPFFEEAFSEYHDQGFIPARITAQHANLYTALSEVGELEGKVTGKFRFEAKEKGDFPTVGDWVAVKGNGETGKMSIHGLLPRKTALRRKMVSITGVTDAQIISSNIDTRNFKIIIHRRSICLNIEGI